MRLLLDTHVLLWAVGYSQRLPPATRDLLVDAANEVYFSAASVWEIAIKSSLRRRDFEVEPYSMLSALSQMGFTELPVSARHAAEVGRLAHFHKDPFDRLLIAQARAEPMVLLTADRALLRYSDNVRLIPA